MGFCLLSLGRLEEAVAPLRSSVDMGVEDRNWVEASVRAGTLAELNLTLGRIHDALHEGNRAVALADKTKDPARRRSERAGLADVLQAAGKRDQALRVFEEAEEFQKQCDPSTPFLFSLPAYWYLDRLLSSVETIAWRAFLTRTPAFAPGARDLCRRVSRYSSMVQELQDRDPGMSNLDVALPFLAAARAALYDAVLEDAFPHNEEIFPKILPSVSRAMTALHRARRRDYLPRGYLTQAWSRFLAGDPPGARADLEAAESIARRGPMRLHLADVHLHRARLFRDAVELQKASSLVEEIGYRRRKPEIDAANAVAAGW